MKLAFSLYYHFFLFFLNPLTSIKIECGLFVSLNKGNAPYSQTSNIGNVFVA